MAVRKRATDGSAAVAAQVRTYLAALAPESRRALRALMTIVRASAPGAKQAFSYRIPAFAIDGRIVVWCAGWKEHVGLYPITPAMARAGGAAIERYRHGKGTLRFAIGSALPAATIRKMVKARCAEMHAGR